MQWMDKIADFGPKSKRVGRNHAPHSNQKIHFAPPGADGNITRDMATPTCTKCRRVIPSDDINVAKDVAYCRQCNVSYRLSDLTFGNESDPGVNLQHPPQGAWYRTNGATIVVGATNRSLGAALGVLFVTLFWNGIVSVFVTQAIVGTLYNFQIPIPAWFPKMGGSSTGPGETLFLWLFLTPFIMIGLIAVVLCFSTLFGRTEVKIANTRGAVFIGIIALGWYRRFDPSQVRDVRTNEVRNEGKETITILIETREGKQIKFGSHITNERRQFIFGALRKTLLK